MPKKVGRKAEDVAKLAENLRDRWEAADGIEPWLKRNRTRFERMVQRERWTWNNLADALTQAGITYGSGRAWKGHTLATKVSEIRVRERAGADREELERRRAFDAAEPHRAVIDPAMVPPVAAPQVAIEQPPHQAEAVPPRRTFRTVTLAGDTQAAAPPQPAEPAKESASAPATKQDADAVHRRFFGNRKD